MSKVFNGKVTFNKLSIILPQFSTVRRSAVFAGLGRGLKVVVCFVAISIYMSHDMLVYVIEIATKQTTTFNPRPSPANTAERRIFPLLLCQKIIGHTVENCGNIIESLLNVTFPLKTFDIVGVGKFIGDTTYTNISWLM
jgi:hypothetical protein